MKTFRVSGALLVLAGLIAFVAGPVQVFAKVKAGDHIPVKLDTPQGYKGVTQEESGTSWTYELHHPDATYIAIHFVDFDLASGDYLIVTDPSGEQFYVMEGKGKMNAGTFWAQHIKGDTVFLELVQTNPEGGNGFIIDEYVAGFLEIGGDKAICGADDKENAVCYESSHPDQYDRARAVARLLSGGSAFCTGWLVSSDNHLITNEHCVSSASEALNTDYEFMAEAPNCSDNNCPDCFPGTIFSGATFVQDDANLDYCLLQITSGNPSSQYGYLELDDRVAVVGEQIYIPQHPDGRAKELSIYSSHSSDTGGVSQVYSITADPCSGSGYYDVGYYADTEGGSSGSPVLAISSNKVIALHHCANCPNRGVPIHLIYDEIADYLSPGPAGAIEFDRAAYNCDSSVIITLKDGDLEGNGTQNVTVTTSTGDSEVVTLTEVDVDAAIFEGGISTTTGTVYTADGMLQIADGATISVEYIDVNDGQGGVNVSVVAGADVDCQVPTVSSVTTQDVQPRSATVGITANEPVRGIVHYGGACGALIETTSGSGYSTNSSVSLSGLDDNTQYYYAVVAEDEAGNTTEDNNNGLCYSFTTPEIPDFYTQMFDGSANDLDNIQLVFTPNSSTDFYRGCTVKPITELPTDSSTGTALVLTDDSYQAVTLTGGATVSLYGVAYNTLYPASNGYITFTEGSGDFSETLSEHFELPRISGIYDDLDPEDGGTVRWEQFADRVVVTWDGVPEHNETNPNTFQIEMFFDGKITISYLAVDVADGLAGLSSGAGLSPDFFETDLSEMSDCGPQVPEAFDGAASTKANIAVTVQLQGHDDGLPDPPAAIDYIVVNLPAHGVLSDPNGGEIQSVPYTLLAGGNLVDYVPDTNYYGLDYLHFKVNDGGTPPNAGDSEIALVTISVVANPPVTQNISLDGDINTPETFNLVGTDPDGDVLDYVIITLPDHGTLYDVEAGVIDTTPYALVNNGKRVTYEPETDYAGDDSFAYRADDGIFNSSSSTVTLTVIANSPQIVTTTIPSGRVGDVYGPVQLDFSGGQPETVWSLVTDLDYIESDLGSSMFTESGVAKSWHKDEGFWLYNLPFAFPFYGQSYTSVRVRPNGFINMGAFTGSYTNNSEAGLIDNVMIAPMWDDLRTTEPGEDVFIDESVSGQVTIRWKASAVAIGNAEVDFAVVLADDGSIRFDYGLTNADVTPTIGISGGDGVHYTIASVSGMGSLTGADSLRFRIPLSMPEGMNFDSGILSGIPTEAGDFEPVFKIVDSMGREDQRLLSLHIDSFQPGNCDYDGDGLVNLVDYAGFQVCYTGQGGELPGPGCVVFRSDVDGDIDLIDFAWFLSLMDSE